jgi:hypothetical protein
MASPIRQISIDGDLSQVSERFALPRVGSDFFSEAERNKPVEVLVGYKGQDLHQLTGAADEWELRWDDRSLTGGLRGRDLGQRMVERMFKKMYFRFPPNPIPTRPHVVNGIVVGQTPLDYAVGAFRASQIAGEVAGHVGLSLTWGAPDYTIRDNVLTFAAPAGECIRRLVQTMGQPEMFAIDVYISGTSLIVRQRQGSYPTPDYALFLSDLMGTAITYRKRPGPIYGTITISGATGGGGEVDRETLPEEVEIIEVNETPRVLPMKGKTRVTTTKRILQSVANEVLLSENSVTEIEVPIAGPFTRQAETRKAIVYDDVLLLDSQGRINLPVKEKEITEHYGIGATIADFILLSRESIGYGYNDNHELILQDILIEELVGSTVKTLPDGTKRTIGGALTPSERRIVRNQKLDANQYQVTTQIFQISTLPSPGGGKILLNPAMELVATDTKLTRGQLPGPQHIRRPHRAGSGGATGTRILREETISTDPDAVDVQISDNNLSEELADQLVNQYRQASGLWRHEVTIDHLALPFLSKGKILGWKEALPNMAEPLPNALIVSRRLEYDESSESPSFRASLGLVWWAAP